MRKRLQTPHRLAALRNVAHRLVASSFYLELQSKVSGEKGEQRLTGAVCCRFDDGSPEMSALGKILEGCRVDGFEPYVLVRPNQANGQGSFVETITMAVIRGMIDNAVFGLPNVYISIRDESEPTSVNIFLSKHDGLELEGFPISGFPKVLLGDVAAAKQTRRGGPGSIDLLRQGSSNHLRSNTPDGDVLSLNGPAARASLDYIPGRTSRSESSEASWQTTQANLSALMSRPGVPKMSLADIIAQQKGSDPNARQRTNRFWTYIGNNHMAQHPELYSVDELSKYASRDGIPSDKQGLAQGSSIPAFPVSNAQAARNSQQNLSPEPMELEADDTITREAREQRSQLAAARPSELTLHPAFRPMSTSDGEIQIGHDEHDDDEYDDDDDEYEDVNSVYSGHEVQTAQASPVVQVSPPRRR